MLFRRPMGRFLGLTLAAALIPLALNAAPKPKARAPARAAKAAAPEPAPVAAEGDWRTPDPANLMVIDTNKGRIVVEMYPDVAPASVAQIETLVRRHFYDGQTFFRVIDEFMDQTGDPKNTGEGGSDLPNLKAEFTFRRDATTPFVKALDRQGLELGFVHALPAVSQSEDLMAMTAKGQVNAWGLFCPGTAGMARAADVDSANSQFFLMRGTATSLDQKYTTWGRVLSGMDVVLAIKTGEPVEAPQDRMVKVSMAPDLPEAERPRIQVLDTRSAAFRYQLRKAVDAGAFSVCDVPVPTRAGPRA